MLLGTNKYCHYDFILLRFIKIKGFTFFIGLEKVFSIFKVDVFDYEISEMNVKLEKNNNTERFIYIKESFCQKVEHFRSYGVIKRI